MQKDFETDDQCILSFEKKKNQYPFLVMPQVVHEKLGNVK